MAISKTINKDLEDSIKFINISNREYSLFEWKPKNSLKRFDLELNIIKQNPYDNLFFHRNRGNMKIAYIKKDYLIYSIGASPETQFQVLEAMLEHIELHFNNVYDPKIILSYGHFTSTVFRGFNKVVKDMFNDFKSLHLVEETLIPCPVCKDVFIMYIKRSSIENAKQFPLPIVYIHKGHPIICYIDRHYHNRGVGIVDISG